MAIVSSAIAEWSLTHPGEWQPVLTWPHPPHTADRSIGGCGVAIIGVGPFFYSLNLHQAIASDRVDILEVQTCFGSWPGIGPAQPEWRFVSDPWVLGSLVRPGAFADAILMLTDPYAGVFEVQGVRVRLPMEGLSGRILRDAVANAHAAMLSLIELLSPPPASVEPAQSDDDEPQFDDGNE
jgi:hypothetical protein